MTQTTSSDLPMRGDLTVKVRSVKSGRILRTFVIRNTVTYLGMGTVVQLLSQNTTPPDDPPASLKLAEIWVGDGVVPPVRGDTALSGALAAKITLINGTKTPNITGPIYELRILATLPATGGVLVDGNGFTLREAGLYTAGSVLPVVTQKLFARQIHPAIVKTSAIAIDYDWRISFTA